MRQGSSGGRLLWLISQPRRIGAVGADSDKALCRAGPGEGRQTSPIPSEPRHRPPSPVALAQGPDRRSLGAYAHTD